MARVTTKIGDVFSVKIDDQRKKYFQYIANDTTQLNSDVIRVFIKTYGLDEYPDLLDVITDGVAFYAHCFIKLGIKMSLWEVVGRVADVGSLNKILFRGTNDAGSKPGEQIKISNRWYVWRINDSDYTRVGKLEGDNRRAEIGVVVNPYDIVNRIKTGKYNFFFPDFE